jgi:hypothetical protein
MTTFTLIAKNNSLYFPQGGDDWAADGDVRRDCPDHPSLLIRRYDEGDMDTCPWPMVPSEHYTLEDLRHNLALALYDERETNGCWPAKLAVTILLPDGTPFDLDDVLADRVLRDATVTWNMEA